jgi:hypothetical protein
MTQARDALNAHIQKVNQLRAAFDEARAPMVDMDAKIAAAKNELAAVEAAHDAALRAEGQLFVSGQDATAATAEVNAKAADLDRLRRLLAALTAQRVEQENVAHDRGTSLNIAGSALESLIANVIAEVGEEVAAELTDIGSKFSAVQAKAKSLTSYLAEKRWFPLVEKLNTRFNALTVPSWQAQPKPNWQAFLASLESDANAPVPAAAQ